VGVPGAVVTIIIAAVTLGYQIQDPNFFKGVIWVIVWCAVGIVYFALVGRHKLILSPEEEFALEHAKK
jgi:ethanolamine permease